MVLEESANTLLRLSDEILELKQRLLVAEASRDVTRDPAGTVKNVGSPSNNKG